jgi:type IV pilus assembly protein PilY1
MKRLLKIKLIKSFLLIIPFLLLLFIGTSFAHDTDLYTASGAGVEPNILIIFDNSISMNTEVQAYFYDNTTIYTPETYPRDTVYYSTGSGGWSVFGEVSCLNAQTVLTNNGHYEGNTNSSCTGTYKTLRTGNYRNYLASIGGDETLPKLTIAKTVIKDFLDTINGVRVGVMIFNNNEGGHLQSFITSLADTTRTQLKNDVNNINANTYTPLAETLYEAGLYFKGGRSYFNSGVNYTSPIQYSCQRNYVIIITDGEPTYDRNSVLKDGATVSGTVFPKIGDQDGDKREPGMVNDPHYDLNGSDYLDDVAKYLYDTDLRSDLTGTQNIITYAIGFTISSSLLERTATLGHGRYFYSQNAQNLASVFQNIIGEILAKSTSFVAPIVPVSRLERTTAGDKIYLAFFKPAANEMWSGNIKKFGVQQTDNPGSGLYKGDITDSSGNKALDSSGQFYSTARSFWTSASMDGGEVEQGGVGEVLMNRNFTSNPRNLYTYFYTNANLNHSSNAFTTGNASITPTVLGLLADDTTGKNKLINFVFGYDAYDDNANGNTTEKRDWLLGSFLHSRPLIIHYGTTRSVIFAGANDGMLHAFDDSDGRELWGFIPPVVLNKLQALHADLIETYVDGSPRTYLSYDANGNLTQAILLFGLRRGGDCYYALDVTNPDVPTFLWEIGPGGRVYLTNPKDALTDYQQLGQTWSSPIIGKIAYGAGEKWVAFIGGGYDTNQDNDPVLASDSKGRAIYVVDLLTGSLVKRFSITEYPDMTYSIPSDISKVDTDGNGKIDRLYVGDMGGRIWRFNICDPNYPDPSSPSHCDADPANWTAKIVFKSNPGASDRRKIFYPPDVTLERDTANYEMLFFGTGDREAPKESAVINRIYAVKDKNPSTPYQESTDLVNVTSDILQDPTKTEAQKIDILNQLKSASGWFITLEYASEKSLATPVVFYKTAYFTTFTASAEGQVGDPCYVGEGTGRLYALKYNNGNAVFNFDLTNDVSGTVYAKTDRSLIMGTAIPSGVIITFVGGTAVAYAGVGGGVYTPQLGSRSPLVPMTWRIILFP